MAGVAAPAGRPARVVTARRCGGDFRGGDIDLVTFRPNRLGWASSHRK